MELEFHAFLLVVLIGFIGSFVQSTTGFGYAVTVMAVWPMIMPFKTAAVLEIITAMVLTVSIAVKYRKYIVWKQLIWPGIASVFMNWVGLQILQHSGETFLRRILGAALMLLAIYFVFFSSKLKIRPTTRNAVIAGGVAGLTGGMFSLGGPPIVAYYLSALEDKRQYTATTQMFFILSTINLLLMHLIMGNITLSVIKLSVYVVAGVAAGTICGLALFKRLNLQTIKKMVYTFMMLMGLYILITG